MLLLLSCYVNLRPGCNIKQMQILPSKKLTPFIKHYLFLKSEGDTIKKLRLFSDGNTAMVFSFGSNLISNVQNNDRLDYLPSSFVYGQLSDFKDLYLVNEADLVVVVFQPAGLNQIMGLPANEFRDKIISTDDLFGQQGLGLYGRLFEHSNLEGKLKMLNTFFIELATKKVFANHLLVEAAVNFIFKNNGTNSISQLTKHVGYTERHIERNFVESIGLSPKKFGNIIKLHNFLKLLKDKSKENNLTSLAYEAGYSDQSHLIKEFRKYTGITPKEYLYKTNKLTSNFIKFNSTDAAVEEMSGLYNLHQKT